MQRRLAAILAADVVGYSRLMGLDEDGALAALRQFRSEAFGPTVESHGGEIVKSMGDGWLVEFASSADAVRCALAVQDGLRGHRLLKLRIGLHIGDIVHADQDIYGDGVNIAARLQEIAVGGGVALSDSIYDSLDAALAGQFVDAGRHDLKNIQRPVAVWLRAPGGEAPSRRAGAEQALDAGFPGLSVLPFRRPEGSVELADLADTTAQDLAAALTSSDWLLPRVRSQARFGDYRLDGGLRARGDAIRLELSLTDAAGQSLWRKNYDGRLSDSFEWQDRVSLDAAGNIFGRLFDAERERVLEASPETLTAEDCVLAGVLEYFEVSPAALDSALAYLRRAIDLKPDLAAGYRHALRAAFSAIVSGASPTDAVPEIPDWLAAAAADAPFTPLCEAIWRHLETPEPAGLAAAAETACAAAPDDLDVLCLAGWAQVWLGQPEAAIDCFRRFRRLGRYSALSMAARAGLAVAWSQAGQDHAAIENAEDVISATSDFSAPYLAKAASAAALAQAAPARDAVRAVARIDPAFTVSGLRDWSGFVDAPANRRFFDGLAQAGLPA